MRVLVFAGTKNGRELAVTLAEGGHDLIVSSASTYGSGLVGEHENMTKLVGKLDVTGIMSIIEDHHVEVIIDATHPYAAEISKNLILVDKLSVVRVIRFERERAVPDWIGHHVSTMSAACEYIGKHTGNALFTTGVNELHNMVRWLDKERFYVRILPIEASMSKAKASGMPMDRVLAIKPPFTKEDNLKHIDMYGIKYLVTKDSGKEGNLDEKMQAAEEAGIELIVIDRPDLGYKRVCYEIDEVLALLEG